MNQNKQLFGLNQEVIEKIESVFIKYPQLEKVVIYGSRAKGNFSNGSDIDLTCFGELNLTELHKIENEIDDLYLPYKFDFSLIKHIDNEDLINHIERVGKLFYLKSSK